MIYIFVKHLIFKENALSLKETLNNYGYNCTLTDNFNYQENNFYIIFGAHDIIEKFPNKYIIYQLEQSNVGYYNDKNEFIDNNHKTFNKKYIEKLQNAYEVWDYSQENIIFFEKINQSLEKKIKSKYVPLCYSSYLSQFKNYTDIEKTIDILFFGSINKRREKIIHKLQSKGLKIEVYNNLINEEKLKKILSSKIILNIHFYEKSLLETHRINFLLANKSFVISEKSRDNFEDDKNKNNIIFCSYNNIVSTCLEWVKKNEERDTIANNGYENFKKYNFMDYTNNTMEKLKGFIKKEKIKNKKINYYFPAPIIEAETNLENNNFVLKLDGIDDKELPGVTIITPTGNRRKMFSLPIKNFQSFIYPKDKIEWLIVDDGKEEIEDLIPNDKRINYIKLNTNERLPIGKKRNISVKMAKYNYIAFMDDDDYYAPESLMARIKTLLKYNKKCVGCNAVGNYNLNNNQSTLSSDGKMYLCEASMAFEKKFWEERNFNEQDTIAEFKYFQHHRQNEMITIPFQFVMVALTHNNNLTGNTRNFNQFYEWYQKNKEDYTDLFKFFDIETQIFINDLRNFLGIKNTQELSLN